MDGRQRPARYAGEDNRLTSKKELLGWYSYGLAAEIFAVCGVGSFLPVTLEQLARERGFLRSDRSIPCVSYASAPSRRPGTDDSGPPPGLLLLGRSLLRKRDDNQCIVHLFGGEINTASFAMYTFSLSVFVQALTLVSVSAIADHGDNRKIMLLGFGFIGSLACMLFIVVFPAIFLVGPLLVITSVTCLGSSFVLLNSFLPLLVANHPDIRLANHAEEDTTSVPLAPLYESRNGTANPTESNDLPDPNSFDDDEDFEDAGPPKSQPPPRNVNAELQLSNQISARGVGIGYIAAVSIQILCIVILVLFSKLTPKPISKSTIPLRLILFFVGCCWAIGSIPTARYLRRRPGPPLPAVSHSRNRFLAALTYLAFAWKSLWRTVKLAAQLRQAVVFLCAWFLLSDAIATVSGTAILFAKTELQMPTEAVAAVSVVATISGVAGAFTWPIIARRFDLKSNQTIICCICLFELIPLYGLLGFIPFIKTWGVGGLQKPWEIFPLAFIHGFVMGGLSSLCRSFYGVLIPPGSEAAFYALYAVTDKGSSVIGPAIVGSILDGTGEIRMAFWFLAVLIVLPAPLVWYVDFEKGRDDAVRMAKRIGGRDVDHGRQERGDEGEEHEELLASRD
ncbi:MFS general substrate transporter [Aulographum hederae CBS 113979]|uniref:Autophagy-related protein n=1 Tax=Aulographum hederae CBS 113979 TaxID=1176131 RepID=A0A6G1GW14_9PEZI|nr:MFS general substrate transporter [Aulographum hederae CBS 113979]